MSTSSPEVEARRAQIAREPRGDYWIGRRYYVYRTHFWGYLRRPGQGWKTARLVVMNERSKTTPDRLPEWPREEGPSFGFDHNYQYKLWGEYTGRKIYDPNSNREYPEFTLRRYELISANPGFLFRPGEKHSRYKLPPMQ